MRDFCMVAVTACMVSAFVVGLAKPELAPWTTLALLGIAALWAIAAILKGAGKLT